MSLDTKSSLSWTKMEPMKQSGFRFSSLPLLRLVHSTSGSLPGSGQSHGDPIRMLKSWGVNVGEIPERIESGIGCDAPSPSESGNSPPASSCGRSRLDTIQSTAAIIPQTKPLWGAPSANYPRQLGGQQCFFIGPMSGTGPNLVCPLLLSPVLPSPCDGQLPHYHS
jgi:hypothetical protein